MDSMDAVPRVRPQWTVNAVGGVLWDPHSGDVRAAICGSMLGGREGPLGSYGSDRRLGGYKTRSLKGIKSGPIS
jgi:hypothetical protein